MINKSIVLIIILGITLLGCRLNKDNNNTQQMNQYDFGKAWEKVDALEKQGLVKTMFNKVTEIHENALKSGAGEQLIKALIYQGMYHTNVEEDGLIKTIESFESSLEMASEPEKSILQSLLAELYDIYLNQNLWKFNNRSQSSDQLDADIRNWSPTQLVDQSTKLYLASVAYDQLHKVEVDKYKELIRTNETTPGIRHTLLDILAHRAIQYFKGGKPFLVESRGRFILNDEKLFANRKEFEKIRFDQEVSSRQKTVLELYQHLTRKHLEENNQAELLDLDLNRISYVYFNFISTDKDKVYENGLKELIKGNEKIEGVAEVYYRLASLYFTQRNKQYENNKEAESLVQKAHRICVATIKTYPDSYGADLCKALKSNIEEKSLQIRTEQINLPGENLNCQIDYKNVSNLYFKLIKIDKKDYEDLNTVSGKEISDFISDHQLLRSWSINLPGTADFLDHSTEMAIESLPVGSYALVSCDDPSFSQKKGMLQLTPFFVSTLSFWHTATSENNQIYVVDRKNGKAVAQAKVRLYEWNYDDRKRNKDLWKTLTTNEEGYVTFQNAGHRRSNLIVEIEKGKELLFFDNALYSGRYNDKPSVNQKILYFLDRALYRPGQTVFFKGILLEENSENKPRILPGQKDLKIRLFDVNQQNVEDLTVNSNEFGSFSGSFTIPSSGLTGQMSIGSDRTRDRMYFNVEEYKRPKFFVEIESYESAYKLGDKIELDGSAKSYAGVSISNAEVRYRVSRKNFFPYWGYFRRPIPFSTNAIEIANGGTLTDANGKFKIPLELLADDLIPASYKPSFRYEIEVDVIDLTGETHTAKSTMQASWLSKDVKLEVPEKSRKEAAVEVKIISRNWNGKDQDLLANLKVYQLEQPTKVYRERFWSKPDMWLYDKTEYERLLPDYSYGDIEDPSTWKKTGLIKDEEVNTAKKPEIKYALAAGSYKLELRYSEPSGEDILLEKYVSVYDDQLLPPFELFSLEANEGEPGEVCHIDLQSAVANLPVLFELFDKDGRQIQAWKNVNRKQQINQEILEKHRGNFFVRASFVHNNRFYTQIKTIVVPWSNKKLDFEYVHFRSVLKPGSEEKWTLKVVGPGKDIVFAELLAGMYDASLDDIKPHNWSANLYWNNYLNSPINYFGFGQARTRNFVDRNWNSNYYSGKNKSYKEINWFGFENIPGYSYYREDLGVMAVPPPYRAEQMMSKRAANGEIAGAESPDMEAESDGVVLVNFASEPGAGVEAEITGQSDVKGADKPIRTNLNETVFFFPHLKTDEAGNVLIEFTMNEALTSWNFLGFSHTKDLKIGMTKEKVITQKELMVRPNPPVFVRNGDLLQFSSSISNLTEEAMSGEVELKLLDARTNADITKTMVAEPRNNFKIDARGNVASNWNIRVPLDQTELIIYQVWAKSGQFTDGEEGYLPVLTNRTLVTETMPMWIGPNEKKTFEFDAMSKLSDPGLTNHSFTVETTSDPIWYAIQAMPYIRDYSDRNCISLANALFANSLAAHIVDQNPAIEKVFKQWKNMEKQGENALASNLQKNQELKNILLRETPWLLEAMDEASQKQNIALLFELNTVNQDKRQIIQFLQGLQRYDGGFSWYPGGKSSDFITMYVLELIGKLQELKIVSADGTLNSLAQKAIEYSDKAISDRYQKLLELADKKLIQLDADQISYMDVYYLYVRSLFAEQEYKHNAREASVYFLNQAQKYWLGKDLYLQGMMALTLHKRGNSATALSILKSVEERSILNPELGRYWKTKPGYHWFELPIETQSMLISAFDKIYEDKQIVAELQLWLLKNKQTNRWKTGKASIAAVHSLLLNRKLTPEATQMMSVELGNVKIQPEVGEKGYEAGTGYFKKEFGPEKIHSGMKNIELENPNDYIAWGAAYWQYFQDLDKIKSFTDTPIKISRELFVVKDGKKGETLVQIDAKTIVKQGDKISVRLRIEVDRSMDFIHLKDQRGAAMESIEQISQYKWSGGLFYYMSPKDSSTDMFIEHLPRGVYILDYTLRAVHAGTFSNGIANIQSIYAPEFSSHSDGTIIKIQ